MSTVVFDISMSLDGFVRAANPTPATPLGDGGEALHTWAIGDADAGGRDVLSRAIGGLGAVICGRGHLRRLDPLVGRRRPGRLGAGPDVRRHARGAE